MSEWRNESDRSLFTYLAFYETDPIEANNALCELMRRYEAMLRYRCSQICHKFPSLEISGDELTNRTFLKATQRAATYKPLEKVNAKPEEHIRYTSAWLFKIAQRLLFDIGRQSDRALPYEQEITDPIPLSPTDVAALLVGANPGPFGSSDKRFIAQAFESLREDWQIVVVWTVDKQMRSPSGRYMNRGSLTALADRLHTTPANIRQIRKRAYDAIGRAVKQARMNSWRGE